MNHADVDNATVDRTPQLHPLLSTRWSPASFDVEHEASEADVATLVEAARWAPSAGNSGRAPDVRPPRERRSSTDLRWPGAAGPAQDR